MTVALRMAADCTEAKRVTANKHADSGPDYRVVKQPTVKPWTTAGNQ